MVQKQRTQNVPKQAVNSLHHEDLSLKDAASKASKLVDEIEVSKPKYDHFKSPKKLGLTAAQHTALVKTLQLMEEGKIHYVDVRKVDWKIPNDGKHYFNMTLWRAASHNCGTIGCIGGTAEMLGGVDLVYTCRKMSDRNLHNLFFGDGVKFETTDQEAAVALRGYLETGKTDWSHLKKGGK